MAHEQTVDRSVTVSCNVAVVAGRVRVDPVERQSADDLVLITFDVVSEIDGIRSTTPVSWSGRPGQRPRLRAGAMVGVTGSIDRRFIRVGGRSVGIVELRARSIARTRAAIQALVAPSLAIPAIE